MQFTFSFHLQRTKTFVFCSPCFVWSLGCDVNFLLETFSWGLSLVAVDHHLVTYLPCYSNRVGSSESLKTFFDEKEDTTLADIIEKIRKLLKSSKIYFSQVTNLLKFSLVLALSEQFASTLRRIKTVFD